MTDEVRSGAEPAPARTSKAYAWYVVAVLVAASTLSFVDRQILAIMIDPVKADLLISDTQAGLLVGLSFAIFYTLVVNFIGYGFGPVFVGLFNDYVYTPAEVHYSVATLGGALYFGAGLLTWLSLPHFRRALQAAESWNEDG